MSKTNKIKKEENEKAMKQIMTGCNVGIDGLAKFITQSGVIVKPHIGRYRVKIALPKQVVVKPNSQEDEDFYNTYVTQGTLNFIPKEDDKALLAIESSTRGKVKALAVACDQTFMVANVYATEYLPYFNEQKQRYMERKESILAKWDILVKNFQSSLDAYLTRHEVPNKEELIHEKMAALPTKEEYARSFDFSVRLTAFPVEENIHMFNKTLANQVKDSISETKMNFVKEMIGTLLGETFSTVASSLQTCNRLGEVKYQQIKPFSALKNKIRANNFLELKVLDDIIDDIDDICDMDYKKDTNFDDVIFAMEKLLATCYGFLKDSELDEYIDLSATEYSELKLSTIYSLLNPKATITKNIANYQ
jgi:hypothetical protein